MKEGHEGQLLGYVTLDELWNLTYADQKYPLLTSVWSPIDERFRLVLFLVCVLFPVY